MRPPLVGGGQGRSPRHVRGDAEYLAWCVVGIVVLLLILFLTN